MSSRTVRSSNSCQRRLTRKRSAASVAQVKGSELLVKSKRAKRVVSDSLSPEPSVRELRSKYQTKQRKKGGGTGSSHGGDITEDSWAGSLSRPLHHFATTSATQLYAKSKQNRLKQKQVACEPSSDKQNTNPKRTRQNAVKNKAVSRNSAEIKKKRIRKQAVSKEKSVMVIKVDPKLSTRKPSKGRKKLDIESFLNPPGDPPIPSSGPFSCTLCGARYPVSTSLVSHMKIHKQTLFSGKCQCGQKFRNSVTFLQHCLQHHPKSYHQKQENVQSTSQGDDPKQFRCDVCGAAFIVARTMEKHRLLHTEGFQCTVCSEIFTLPRDLKDHMTKHLRGNHLSLRHPGYWASFKAPSGNTSSARETNPQSKPVPGKIVDEEHSQTALQNEGLPGIELANPCLGSKPELVCFTQGALGARPDQKKIVGVMCRGCSKVFRAMPDFFHHMSGGTTIVASPGTGPSYLLNVNSSQDMNSAGSDRNTVDSSNVSAQDAYHSDDSDAVSESFSTDHTLNHSQGLTSGQSGTSLVMEQENDSVGPECLSHGTLISDSMNEDGHILPYGVQVKVEPGADDLSCENSIGFHGIEQSSNIADVTWAQGIKMEQPSLSYQVYYDIALDTEKAWTTSEELSGDVGGEVDTVKNSASEIAEEIEWDEGAKKVKIELSVNWACDPESQEYGNEASEIWQISVNNSDDESAALEEDSHAPLSSNQGMNITELQDYEHVSQSDLWKIPVRCEEDAGALEQGTSHKVPSDEVNPTSHDEGQACGERALHGQDGYETQAELNDVVDKVVNSEEWEESDVPAQTQHWVTVSDCPIIKQEPGVFPVHLVCNAQVVQSLHEEQNQGKESDLN